jgi:Tfp pilus assembly protein PilN
MHNQVALGIDISGNRINMALLKRVKSGAKVLKAGSAPVPEGAIKDGCIKQPEVLAKVIKELKSRNRIRAKKAAVSLSAGSTIVRIMDAPKGAPNNIGRFVQNELKSYIALSGKAIASDFCGIKSGYLSSNRLLAVAGDSEELALLTRTCSRTHLDVEVIEPPILGYIRALYTEKIEGKFDSDVLIVVLHSNILTFCVFRKQILDFVRIEAINGENAKAVELCQWLTDEINEIIQFYDVEVTDCSGKWEVTIVTEDIQLPEDVVTSMGDEIPCVGLDIRTGQNACRDTNIDFDSCKAKPSALAIGLAMGLLNVRQTGLKVNLVPPESAEVKATKRQLVLTAIIVLVAIPLLMIAGGMGINKLADNVKTSIADKKQTELSGDICSTSKELNSLNQEIELLSKRPAEINEILNSRPAVDWAKILNDIRIKTPKSVRITGLYSTGDTEIVLEGSALSYESARLFEKMLNDLEYISSASLTEASREENADALVTYRINCSLITEKIGI